MRKTTYQEAMERIDPNYDFSIDLVELSNFWHDDIWPRDKMNQMLENGFAEFKDRDNIPLARLVNGDAQLLITERDFDNENIAYGLIDMNDPRINGGKPYTGYIHLELYEGFEPDLEFETNLPLSAYVK